MVLVGEFIHAEYSCINILVNISRETKYVTVIYNMSIDRADKPWIGDRRFTEASCIDGAMAMN